MTCTPSKILTLSICLALLSTGCMPSKPGYLHDAGDLSSYIEHSSQIDYPDVDHPTLDEVTLAHPPMTVIESDFGNFEDMTLEDAVEIALDNTKVIRGYGTPSLQSTRVMPGQDNLANGPAAAATTYNVAIRQTEPGIIPQIGQFANPNGLRTNSGLDGNQGEEAALAEFDAHFTSNISYAKSDEPKNGTSFLNSEVFQQDQVSWQSQIAKKSANGTQIFFRHVNQYTDNNNPLLGVGGVQALDSWYRTSFEAEIRQPLLRGRGTFINRMPIVISRIGTDQEIANLESTLQNMVTNVEIRYWDLYCAYRTLDAAKTGRDAALETYRIVKNQFDEGAEVNIQQVAQASEQYYFFGTQVVDAYNQLLNTEGQLRYLLGWSSTDGRFIRPIDEPIIAPVEFDWLTSLGEMLTYRPELRLQRWEIKKLQLELAYSKNGLLPELDISMMYRWLGLGNKYGTSGANTSFPDPSSGALNELYDGNYQEFQLNGSLAIPIGYRRELAMVRNAQLKLAREMARVEDAELDMTRELSEAIRALAANQLIIQSSFNRWKSTTIEKEHFERLEDAGVNELNVALDAQKRRSQSERDFYTAICEYNKVIALIHRRKGTILAYNGIDFSEGAWPGKAYSDALEHARRRGASKQINYGWSRPGVISRGEDWPTGDNRGKTPIALAVPVGNDASQINSTPRAETMGEADPIELAPYYGSPVLEGGQLEPRVPTLAVPVGTGASVKQPNTNGVQRVSFEEDVPAPVRQTPALPASVTRPARGYPPQSTPRQSNLDWGKLGLSRPQQTAGPTTAEIKIK